MSDFPHKDFQKRHIGINDQECKAMLKTIGVDTLDQLIDLTIPSNIRSSKKMDIPVGISEYQYLSDLKKIAQKNKVYKNYIGQGYYGTITPSVILRNVFHNPGWYTQYTPYQAEIAQGRLEALLNFQTMVSDLTGLPMANASLLDEGTAAAEAMAMFRALRNKKRKKNPATKFFIDDCVFEQTVDIMYTRAIPLGIEIVRGNYKTIELDDDFIGCLIQYPNSEGSIEDYRSFSDTVLALDTYLCVAADLMSLALLTPPGEWGAHVVVGNTQRFGVPMGYGGPHAGYFATLEEYKRQIPGRIIGVSQDRLENRSLRMALQTREQHIKRDRATSNICTAQALLAVMAGMYAVYHGPDGIKHIANTIHHLTFVLANNLKTLGYNIVNDTYFDTISIRVNAEEKSSIKKKTEEKEINFFYSTDRVSISVDETTNMEDIHLLLDIFSEIKRKQVTISNTTGPVAIPEPLLRNSEYLTHQIFSSHHTETKMMRYLKSLENKDLSLVHSMIALGSCTMKLNAATELIPVSWPEFSSMHPFAPIDQAIGYLQIFDELGKYLCEITGFEACSFQPNSGAQGEFAGLLTIGAYHKDKGEPNRNIVLIPSSAHGTNPASAVMAGMKVVVVKCDDKGNIDLVDLTAKAEEHKENLSSLMITYPSTHGVFEPEVMDICDAIHKNGGMVYMDGANMNAQIGFTNPGIIGADVCHLNLHKTFAIPHGGGGPGVGPICSNKALAPYLPGHKLVKTGGEKAISAVSSAPWGSASILLISYAYIKLMGSEGLTNSTSYAILNANYVKARLSDHYPVLYTGTKGMAAHEMIIDLRQFKPFYVSAEDVAKRLVDYGFHSPTLSFPVAGTIMIEPTESEDKDELDRFCDALISIKKEIDAIANGTADPEDNVLRNAPHTLHEISANTWSHPYSRSEAAYPLPYLYTSKKFWATTTRIDNAFGDRHLICTCPPIEAYEE